MNKKVLAITVIALIIGWFAYRATHAPVSKNEVVIDSDTVSNADKNAPPSLKVNKTVTTAPNAFSKVGEVKSRVHETPDEKFEEFDKLEKVWLSKVQVIVGEKNYPLYLDMRNRNEKEKMQAYKEYHDYLRQKYGDNFSYNISEDQSIREKQINQRYLKELLKLIGPVQFKQYTEARDLFNESMRRQNKESIQIEF